MRDAIGDILAMEDIGNLKANGGQHGLDIFIEYQEQFELILLDLSMPGLSGEETLRLMRQRSKDVNIVLTSGYPESEMITYYDGDTDYLQKPYNVTQLIEKVQKHL